jgi:riboflavin synthase
MFTGIIEEVAIVKSIRRSGDSARIAISAPKLANDVAIGDSVAINGVCLTAVELQAPEMSFDAVPETVERSNLKYLKSGDRVNVELSLQVGGRLSGHFVQGHVDGTGNIRRIENRENARVLTIETPRELMPYVASKGSIAVDGISLTVVDVGESTFTVWIIPHTYANTTLRDRTPGDSVNLEIDMLARYIERLLEARTYPTSLTEAQLLAAGFET